VSRVASLYPAAGTLPRAVKSTTDFKIVRDMLGLIALGCFGRELPFGGSDITGVTAEATGDYDLYNGFPHIIDNSSSQLSNFSNANGGTLVCQVRFLLRVSNAGINITPKLVYGTSMSSLSTVATLSGQAACAATSSAYTGTNQYQAVSFTLPVGAKWFKPLITVAGTPAAGYLFWARAVRDLYIDS
jgi:hypothetical protein